MSEKINVLIGANIEGLKTALAESGRSLSEFGTLAQQAPKKAKTAVDELNASYRQAVNDAKNLALTQGATSEAFYEAQIKAKNLRAEIEGLNQLAAGSTGVQQITQRFDGLGNSVNQLTRELPAFTYSMQTGFMAVSNNIPMFVDQINNIKKANAGLIAQGKPIQSVFAQLGSALFSWNTAISLGVTILTVYGEKLINFFTGAKKSKEELEKLANAQQSLNDKIREYLMTDQEKELDAEAKAYKEVTDGIKARIKQTVTLKDEYGRTADTIKHLTLQEILDNDKAKKDLLIAEQRYQEKIQEIKKSYASKDVKNVTTNQAIEEGLNYKTQIKKLEEFYVNVERLPKPQIGKIELKDFIDTKTAMSGFDKFLFEFSTRLDDIEAKVGKWSDVMAGLLTNAAIGLGEALVTDDFKSYGESILRMLGDLAIQIGSAIITLGTAMLFGPTVGLGLAYIAGGTGLVILGSAMKANNVSSPKKPNTSTSGDGGSSYGSSGGGNIPSFNPTGMMISIDGLVRGNNIVVALDNQTRMNRRVR
jgi:hypothetical protein